MWVEGRCSIKNLQFFKMLFIKNIKLISFKFNPLSAQAGSLCHQLPWDRLMESQWKGTFARGSKVFSVMGSFKIPPAPL
jgi:hypothetical protein